MKNISRKVGLIACVATLALGSVALAADWKRLGERRVSDRADHDKIMVTGEEGRFTALKFAVKRHAVHFKKVVVHYHNGGDESLDLRDHIRAGGETRVIDVNGDKRVIRSIEFWYEADSLGKGGAVVSVHGRR